MNDAEVNRVGSGWRTELQMNAVDHGHDQTTDEAYHRAAMLFRDALRVATGGAFTTAIHPKARMGTETQMLEKLISGDLVMANITAANAAPLVPELGLFSAPYLFSGDAHFARAMTDARIRDRLRDILRARFPTLDCVAWFTPGPRNIYSSGAPVIAPEDLKGLRIRVMAAPVETRIWKRLGADPVALPFGEISGAMTEGRIEAAEDTAAVYLTQRHYEIGPCHALTGHQWSVAMMVANMEIANRLSSDLPAAMRVAGERIAPDAIDHAVADAARCTAALRDMPEVRVVDPDVAAFRQATAEMAAEIAEETEMGEVRRLISAYDDQ